MNEEMVPWLSELGETVPEFLSKLRDGPPGFYRYSLTGDRYDPSERWGLGNTVFAVKTYHTLGVLSNIPSSEKDAMARFIRMFQDDDGVISDPVIEADSSRLRPFLADLKNLRIPRVGQQTVKRKRAESRQAFTALWLLDERPDLPYFEVPYTRDGAREFLNRLDWSRPWDAGSHFSHLVYFYRRNNDLFRIHESDTDELIHAAVSWVADHQSQADGCWYEGSLESVSAQQRLNGAMKVLSGLAIVEETDIDHAESLIDFCLTQTEFEQACDILNVVYVLYILTEINGIDYRRDAVYEFAQEWLSRCREHYHPDIGGFSFYSDAANQQYYGTKVSAGKNEPDIHGTTLLIWGIMMTAEILDINEELNFRWHLT